MAREISIPNSLRPGTNVFLELLSIHAGTIRDFAKSHSAGFAEWTATLEDGYGIRTVQELLGHKSVETTVIYTHVLNKGGRGVTSALDSARFDSRATLKIGDRLRRGALYPVRPGGQQSGTLD